MKCNLVGSPRYKILRLVGNFPSVLKDRDVSAFFMESDIEFKNKRLYEEKFPK